MQQHVVVHRDSIADVVVILTTDRVVINHGSLAWNDDHDQQQQQPRAHVCWCPAAIVEATKLVLL